MEYEDNEMVVMETPVVTNFFLAEGEKYGFGLLEKNLDYVQFYVVFVDESLPDPRTGKKSLILQKGETWQDEKSVIAG